MNTPAFQCPGCGYALSGGESGSCCPECGRGFTIRELAYPAAFKGGNEGRVAVWLIGIAALANGAFLGVGFLSREFGFALNAGLLALLAGSACFSWFAAPRRLNTHGSFRPDPWFVAVLTLGIAALEVMLSLLLIFLIAVIAALVRA